MIIKREWHRRRYKYHGPREYYEGWFLLGIIPLYIRSSDWCC
jgi:hypothetical protein